MKSNLFFRRLLLLWVFAFSTSLWGQTPQPLDYTMPNSAQRNYLSAANGWTQSGIGSDYSSSGSNIKFDTTGDTATLTIASAPDKVKYNLKSNGLGGSYIFELSESSDGSNFTTVQSITSGIGGSNTVFESTLLLSTRYIKWTYVNKASGNIGFGGVNVTAAVATGPTITASPATLNGFTYMIGSGPSAEQSFSVNGTNLTNDITVTAPANFEVSTTSGVDFGSSVTLAQTDGTVASTTVYARMIAGLAVNNYSGNIVLSSTGATDVNVAVSGEVTAVPATVTYNVVQFPNTTQSITEGNTLDVYIRAYSEGVTEVSGESPRLKGWIGYSTTNDNPANAGWTWIPATFNEEFGNNDEYKATLPNTLAPGTYYYAARFELDNNGAFTYGGSGGNWNNDSVTLNVSANAVDFANVQSPATATIFAGNTVTVYAQVYEPGITEAAGQGAGITGEIGYSTANTTPDGTWTWLPATYNVDSGNNDEYQANLGANLTSGTYYYASRFIKAGSSIYVYGGTGGIWNNDSGVLTVTTFASPVATAATAITTNSFTANWNAVPDATSYELDVYKGTTTPATTITETFSNIGGGTTSSYTTRTWSGDGGVNWTAYKARTDEVINAADEAITLQNASGAYLESGVMTNGLTNISFDVKQVFSGSGGVLTIKVLSDPTFTTVTTIGTISYNTTASTYDSGPISGITGDYKIRIENNAAARPAIDNLSFTSLPNSTRTYVLSAENVGNVTSYEVIGLDAGTTYSYVVRATSGAATSTDSNEIQVPTAGTAQITWDGSVWSNGTGPTSSMDAIIDGHYNIGNSFEAKSVTVNTGNTLTITSSVKVEDVINNGAIIVSDNASLVQNTGGTYSGTGTFTVNRNSISPLNKYAFWSSPVTNQNMFDVFTGYTAAYVMTYNTATNFYDILTNPATAAPGVGYSIKTPATAPTATFAGAPNNGAISVALSTSADQFNLVGNPYPSNLDLAAFYTLNNANIGSTLWFWDNTGGTVTTQTGSTANNFGYATYNASSKTWLKAPSGATAPTENYAKIGHGFIVEALTNTLTFDNTLRVADAGVNLNKTAASMTGEGKYWLTLSTSYNANVTQAITYQNDASNDLDTYDSRAIGLGSDAFYSFAGAEKVVIQGKAPFNTDDTVQLANKHFENGTFKIELTQKEGLFADGQAIYLKDNLLGTEVNLQDGAYLFSSDAGEFSTRFEVVYSKSVLGTGSGAKTSFTVYRNGDDFIVDSPSKISSVEVYDASGKLVKSLRSSGNKETVSDLPRGVFIMKIKTASETVTKKVIK